MIIAPTLLFLTKLSYRRYNSTNFFKKLPGLFYSIDTLPRIRLIGGVRKIADMIRIA